jgi:hypothetical protein
LLIFVRKTSVGSNFSQITWKKKSIFNWQDCFAILPVGFMDNAMFVLEIVNITYSVLVFPG